MIGTSIGTYEILEKLYTTETFDVYKAVDILLDRNVYVKALKREFMNQSEIADNFRLQAETLAKLAHPCVPTLHYLTATDGRLFMIIESLKGETLDKILRCGKLSFENAFSIFAQVLDCLDYAHNAGIRHGDLKISDIILIDAETPKILGFGETESFQNDGFSPEQKSAFKSDVYAVGKILYETLTGENFIDGQIEETKRRLYSLEPAVPQSAVDALIKVLFENSDRTFQTAAEFKESLIKIENDEPVDFKSVENKTAAVYSVNFAANKKKFTDKVFIKNSPKPKEVGKSVVRRKKEHFALAGLAICAIIVFHLAFQFSFIQSENVKIVEELSKNEQPEEAENFSEPIDENVVEPDINDAVEMEAEQTESEKAETRIKYETEKPENIVKPKTVSSRVQPRPKTAPRSVIKKKDRRETRAERLRRAEKILTGV